MTSVGRDLLYLYHQPEDLRPSMEICKHKLGSRLEVGLEK